jgi:hypothetical protein
MENQLLERINRNLLDSIFRQFDENRKDRALVYHYTSFETIQKILKGDSLRFGSLNNQADKKELIFGLEVLRNLLERHGEYTSLVDLVKTKTSGITCADGIKRQFYIFCASEKKDVYRQWLRYGGQARGVCMSINRKELFGRLSGNGDIFSYIYPVMYYKKGNDDYSLIKPRIKGFENDMLAYFSTLNDDVEDAGNDEALKNEIFQVILVFASLIKDAAYRGEDEWRYLALPKETITDEYLLLEGILGCIEAIILGPRVDVNESLLMKELLGEASPEADAAIDIYKSEQRYLFVK